MGTRIKKLLLILGVGFTLIIGGEGPAQAMMQQLSQEQIDEALKYGQRSVGMDILEFLREWGVGLGPDKGDAILITEFLALALAARDFASRGRELNPFDIQDTLAKSSGKLVFRVMTYGDKPDFAMDYTAILQVGDRVIPNSFWNNNLAEAYGDGRGSPAFVAESDFFFPAAGIDPNSKVTLIIQDKNRMPVAQFRFDLARLR